MALTFDDTQVGVLLARLGLPEDTDDLTLVIDTVKDVTRDPMQVPNDASASQVAAAAKKHGLELLDADSLAALKQDAEEGRRIVAAAAQAKVEATVDDAVNKGKITAARRKHWVTLIQADPGMADVLAAIPDETAVPLSEMGHSADTGAGNLAEQAIWFY
ncbi:hypothetical protein HMPREF0591_4871 [Mycobacterium parascrofulaceum ATCC BAA-614]|uniref:Mu-like prophage I protein n=1 Tax=Mycobacterium parascrofulaceum ATCC BAA-614 TaxID=525368 RepID=D5PFC3_9MYCO|nr:MULTISPECIES: hypothetical protein [Mycobacterium]EFG75193.1 hypothetical protein HMPREF0591_4871 [Mycobacterium parascrofulaceum ATCC BAA-614]OCB36755.1 hypothetical protein A9X02_20505 [Mycobacterium malmoense]